MLHGWRLADRKHLRMSGYSAKVRSLSWSGDGDWLATSGSEQLILWPALQSMLHGPGIIVATGNGWWTTGTSIVGIQQASTIAWAKLFDLPVVMAFNT